MSAAEDSLDDSDEDHGVTVVISTDQMLQTGLSLIGVTIERLERNCGETQLDWFVSHYGATPTVLAQTWEDLQISPVMEARVPPKKLKVEYFFVGMHFLKRYPTEMEREVKHNRSRKTLRNWGWYYMKKIQLLQSQKIVWPADNFGDAIWVVSVDGTDCWINEPKHPDFSQDSRYWSHKCNKAGLRYELAISLRSSNLVWMKGPYPCGRNLDRRIFRKVNGLRAQLRATNKKGIADGGYTGDPKRLSTPNAHDHPSVAKFKRRALRRHERFNAMTKTFKCLDSRFRHGERKFKVCFEAVCVICQYQLEFGQPLFEILVGDIDEL